MAHSGEIVVSTDAIVLNSGRIMVISDAKANRGKIVVNIGKIIVNSGRVTYW